MNKTKVSIIIPVYNPGNLLKKCLDSAMNQTLSDIEIICIDDGSTDGSLDVLNEYSINDSRFKVFTQKNSGAGAARNVGIENAEGEYVIFLDSDDWIESNMCELLYEQASKLDVDLTLFNARIHQNDDMTKDMLIINPDADENFDLKTFDYHYVEDKVFFGFYGVIWNKFYRLSFLKSKNILFEKHKMFNDVEFHIKSLLLADKICYLPEIFYHYQSIGQPSLQNSLAGTGESMCFYDVMVGVRKFIIDNDFFNEFKRDFLNYSFYYFINKLDQITPEFKSEYYLKIKEYFESMTISLSEFERLSGGYFIFLIHLINSDTYEEFESMQNTLKQPNFRIDVKGHADDGIITEYKAIGDDIKLYYNKFYVNVLENQLKNETANYTEKNNQLQSENQKLKEELAEMKKEYENLNLKKQESEKTITDLTNEFKYLKNEISTIQEENKNILSENETLKNNNNNLNNECENLKNELDEMKSSKLWKLKNKL